jgi:uncharacterized cupredoxin-like copper-binding protein
MKRKLLIVCAFAALAAAGCGGSSSSSSSTSSSASSTAAAGSSSTPSTSPSGTLHVTAVAEGLKFDTTSLNAKAGKVTIIMKNDSPLMHDIAIKGGGVDAKGPVVGQGGASTVTADLKPGKYTFYCSVDGHETAGMAGTLSVK